MAGQTFDGTKRTTNQGLPQALSRRGFLFTALSFPPSFPERSAPFPSSASRFSHPPTHFKHICPPEPSSGQPGRMLPGGRCTPTAAGSPLSDAATTEPGPLLALAPAVPPQASRRAAPKSCGARRVVSDRAPRLLPPPGGQGRPPRRPREP